MLTRAVQAYPCCALLCLLCCRYELPSEYSTLTVQYRYGGDDCVARYYNLDNGTVLSEQYTYNTEPGMVEMMLQSEHRTLDPEEAGE